MKRLWSLAALALVIPGAAGAAGAAVAADTSPPVITYSFSGSLGSNDWYRSDVGVTWYVSDPESIYTAGAECFSPPPMTASGQTRSCSASSAGGSTNVTTIAVKIDKNPPSGVAGAASRGPDSNGWYTSPVDISFNGSDGDSGIAGCTSTSYGGPDSGSASVSGSCSDQAGNVSGSVGFSLKYDASGPSIEPAASRGPDGEGWYRSPVTFSASGSDGASGLAGCSGASYGGPDTSSTSVSVSCRDNAGNTSSRSIEVKYDATAPEVTGASLDRNPDSGDWYTRPVNVTFAGADGMSGVAACTAGPYSGPDRDPATVTGTCRDKAGNQSAAKPFTFRYDATPPKLTKTEVKKGDKFVTLSWAATGGAASSQILRSEGSAEPAVVYQGAGSSFTDRGVKNGVRYRYIVAVADAAGNADRTTVVALPRPALYQPERGAKVRGTVTFAWEKVPKATYYNLQLHRLVRGRWVKVLTRWPAHPYFHLARRWESAAGTTDRLTAGRYRWYVWPGFKKRTDRRYGKLVGSSEFVARG